MAGTVINFDDIRHEVVKVIKRGHTYALRDDIPMEVVVRAFGLKSVGERLQSLQDQGATEEDAAVIFDEVGEETIPICGDIVRHSYPDMSDDEIAALFSLEERMQLIQVFFQRRLAQLQTQPDATSDATAQAQAQVQAQALREAQAQQAPNRATRRVLSSSRRATTPRPPR